MMPNDRESGKKVKHRSTLASFPNERPATSSVNTDGSPTPEKQLFKFALSGDSLNDRPLSLPSTEDLKSERLSPVLTSSKRDKNETLSASPFGKQCVVFKPNILKDVTVTPAGTKFVDVISNRRRQETQNDDQYFTNTKSHKNKHSRNESPNWNDFPSEEQPLLAESIYQSVSTPVASEIEKIPARRPYTPSDFDRSNSSQTSDEHSQSRFYANNSLNSSTRPNANYKYDRSVWSPFESTQSEHSKQMGQFYRPTNDRLFGQSPSNDLTLNLQKTCPLCGFIDQMTYGS